MVPWLTPLAPSGKPCLSGLRPSLKLAVGAKDTTVLPSWFLIVTEQTPLGSVSSLGSRLHCPARKSKGSKTQRDRDAASGVMSTVYLLTKANQLDHFFGGKKQE